MQWSTGRVSGGKKQSKGSLHCVNNLFVRMLSRAKRATKNAADTTTDSIFSFPTSSGQGLCNSSSHDGRWLFKRSTRDVDTTDPGNIEMVDILLDSAVQSRNHSQYIDFEDSASLRTWGSSVQDATAIISTERSKYAEYFSVSNTYCSCLSV